MGWKRISASNYFLEEDVKHSRQKRQIFSWESRPSTWDHSDASRTARTRPSITICEGRGGTTELQKGADEIRLGGCSWRENWALDRAAPTTLYVFVSCASWFVNWSNSWGTLLHHRSNKASLSAQIPEHKVKWKHLFISLTDLRMSTKESWFFNNY